MTNLKRLAFGVSTLLSLTAISTVGSQAATTQATTTIEQQPQPEIIAQTVEEVEVEDAEAPTQAAPADFQPASRERVEELLELINADSMSDQILEQMIGQFRQLAPDVPNEWWDGFIAKALESDINSLLVPIYERNYSAEEVDGLIEFYQSPVGQSLLAKTPIVTQESIEVGQAWGLQLAEELIEELEADGYDFSVDAPASGGTTQPQ